MSPARRMVARGLAGVGGATLVRAADRLRRRPGRGLVLMYHRISAEPDYLGLCVSPANFERQLVLLQRSARVRPLSEFAQRVCSPEALDEDIAAITFDDGYRDNLEVALPILARHGLPAAVFVTTDFVDGRCRPVGERLQEAFTLLWQRHSGRGVWADVGDARLNRLVSAVLERPGALTLLAKLAFSLPDIGWKRAEALIGRIEELAGCVASGSPRMLDWNGVRQLAASGIEIGSHTISHPVLSGVSRAEAERELIDSKQRIEEAVGTPVRGLAFPNGRAQDFTDSDVQCARRAGYAYACTTERGVNLSGADPYRLLRLGAGDYAGGAFDLRLAVGR